MAITNEIQKDIIALVVGMFDAAPGQAILEELATAYEGGASITDLANHLAGTAQFKSLYPTILTNEQFSTRLVDAMVGGLVSADDRQWAIDALTGSLNSGASRGETALEAVNALRAVESSNAGWADAAAAFENKIDVAQYFSITLGKNSDSLSALQSVVANVDETAESVDAAKEAADQFGNVVGDDVFFLEAGRDNLAGTSGADLFIADVVANAEGRQVNSLATGDRLNGGAGYDTLEAQITRGATFGDSNMAIQPRTTSVEKVLLEAQNADLPNAGGNTSFPAANTQVYVNATDMTSLDYIGSDHSSADLIIQNLTTRTDAGQLRNTSEVTIGMRYTNPSDTNWQSSDLHVYFAQNNLISDIETTIIGSQANYWLLDQDSDDYATRPLDNIDRDGIRFVLDGVSHLIRPADEVLLDANTWEEYAAGIRTELARLVDGGATQLAGIEVIVDESNVRQAYNVKGQLITIPSITLIDNNGGVFSELGFTIPLEISGDFDVFGRTDTLPPETDVSAYVTATIELEKVGRGADGGDLVVGGMSKNSTNTWNGVQGVEQFNVNVVGGEDLPNWLSGLHSTNNQLQIVNIASVAGGDASLAIGSAADYGLKDVRVLNGAEFNGDLSVSAELTTESISKYFDLNDAQGDAALDDIFFDYSLTGSGDNSLVLDVAAEISSHDDFVLTVLSGEGDDYIQVSLYDGSMDLANWYAEQSDLANASISTGAGDDTVWTPGSGDVVINTGAGDDTVYTDDSGDAAIWVTNANNLFIDDLLGAGRGDNHFLWGTTLTVTYSGGTAGGVTIGDAIANDNGWESTVTVPTTAGNLANHTHINQAIKDAINNDPVLNKLLVAVDDHNFSLVIRSLVDGQMVANDLAITLTGPTAAQLTALSTNSPGQYAQLVQNYGDFINNSGVGAIAPAALAGIIGTEVSDVADAYQGIDGSSFASATPYLGGTPGVAEVQTIDFTGLTVNLAGDVLVGGVAVAVAAADTADQIAAKVAAALAAAPTVGASTVPVTTSVTGSVVTVTFDPVDGDVAPIVVADDTATFTVVSPGVAEQQEIDFTGVSPVTANGTLSIGGLLVNVAIGDTDADIATKVAAAVNGQQMTAPLGNVTATATGEVVTVTFALADGNVADIAVAAGSAAFTGALTDGVETTAYVAPGPIAATAAAEADVVEVTDGVAEVPAAGFTELEGANSTALTDNTINLGAGNDIVVLSTSDEANETLVWTGLDNGVNTIVNFSTTGDSIDELDFTAYLTNMTSVSGSAASAVDIATTVQLGAGAVTASEVVVTTFASLNVPAASGITWANLTAATLASTLNTATNTAWTVAATANLYGPVGTVQKAVFMIENAANEGEYKIFEVSLANTTAGNGFTGIGLIGVADFGDTLDSLTNANFVA